MDLPLNIGVDIRCLMTPYRTGVAEYTFELMKAVLQIDHTNQYYFFYNSRRDVSAYLPHWTQTNAHLVSTRWPNKLFNTAIYLLRRPRLDRLIIKTGQKKRLDVFFSPNLHFSALSKNIKQILTVHDLSFEFFPENYTLKQRLWHHLINPRKQCREAELILTPSFNTKRDLVDFYHLHPNKIKVLYPGPSADFTQRLSLKDLTSEDKIKDEKNKKVTLENIKKKYLRPEHFILFLGTNEPRKNGDTLIKAFELFLNNQTGRERAYSLVIAGAPGWKNNSLQARALASSYKDQIIFLGYIEPAEKPALYEAADLFVYPSFYEGFGFPVLEALAAGTPVITSNRSSLPEITGPHAYLVNPHRAEELAEGMKQLLTNDSLRSYFIKQGQRTAQTFNWQKTAVEWIKTIGEIIKTN